MYFMEPIAIFIACILSLGMINALMSVTPFRQSVINIIFISVDQALRRHGAGQHWVDGRLLDIGQQLDGDFAVPLQQAENRRLLFGQGAAPTRAFQASPTAFSPEFSHNFRVALMPGHDVDFIALDFATQDDWLFFSTTPARNCVVICWASPQARSSSAATCSFDKFKPIKYRQSPHTFNG